MRLIRFIMQRIWKSCTGISFLISVFSVLFLCTTAVIGQDHVTDAELIVLQMLFRKEEVSRDIQYSAWNVFCSAGGTWLAMFAPILASVSFVPEFLSEQTNQYSRFIISRMGRRIHTIGNLLSAMIIGGLTFVCGYALFGIFSFFCFPSIQEYPPESIALYAEVRYIADAIPYKQMLLEQQLFLPVCIQLLLMFAFGACSTLPAVVLSAYSRNPYVVICVPFFLVYTWTQANTRLLSFAYADFEHINYQLERFAKLTDPSAIRYLPVNGADSVAVSIIYFGVSAVLGFVFYYIRNRSVDCGE